MWPVHGMMWLWRWKRVENYESADGCSLWSGLVPWKFVVNEGNRHYSENPCTLYHPSQPMSPFWLVQFSDVNSIKCFVEWKMKIYHTRFGVMFIGAGILWETIWSPKLWTAPKQICHYWVGHSWSNEALSVRNKTFIQEWLMSGGLGGVIYSLEAWYMNYVLHT